MYWQNLVGFMQYGGLSWLLRSCHWLSHLSFCSGLIERLFPRSRMEVIFYKRKKLWNLRKIMDFFNPVHPVWHCLFRTKWSHAVPHKTKTETCICKHINQFIEENNFAAVFTISAGILPLPDLSRTGYEEIIKRTDFSLTVAKQHGRNCCYIFQEEEYQNFLRIREITNELHSAVNHDFRGFSIIFQPVMDIRQDKLTGAEVLIRFASKEFGPISPAEFIPLLETSGLIIPTGR